MAEPTLVEFPAGETTQVGQVRIWTKRLWRDEWQRNIYMHAEEVVFSVAPSIPTATLRWDYGRMIRRWSNAWEDVEKITWPLPRYVKIEIECEYDDDLQEWDVATWYGVIRVCDDRTDGITVAEELDDEGRQTALPSGVQIFTAYGFERLLEESRPRQTCFSRAPDDFRVPIPGLKTTFNADGRPNRASASIYNWYLFEEDLEDAQYWSTQEIVRYLLGEDGPRNSTNGPTLVFQQKASCYFPNWDRPELPREDATTYALINRLLHAGRLLNWWLEVTTDQGIDTIELATATMLDREVQTQLPNNHRIPAAARQLHLVYDLCAETTATLKDTDLPVVDVVVIRGNYVLYVATLSLIDELVPSWTDEELAAYCEGASAETDYAGWDLTRQQRANAAARSRPEIEDVLSKFELPVDWDQRTVSGRARSFTSDEDVAAMKQLIFIPWSSDELTETALSEIVIQPALPLYYGFSYVDSAISDIASETAAEPTKLREYLPPLAALRRPDTDEYILTSELGRLADTEAIDASDEPHCTMTLAVPPRSRSVRLKVSYLPQHVLFPGGEFAVGWTPTSADEIGPIYDAEEVLFTVAMTNGVRLEERWPLVLPEGRDVVRVLEIPAEDHYEAIYVVPNTVVGIDVDGEPARSDGGWIERPPGMRKQLRSLAQVAHEWYSQTHRVLSLTTTRLKGRNSIRLGDLVVRVGSRIDGNTHEASCQSPITEIRYSWPTQEGDGPPQAPTMSITTTAGELNAQMLQTAPYQSTAGVERRAPRRSER